MLRALASLFPAVGLVLSFPTASAWSIDGNTLNQWCRDRTDASFAYSNAVSDLLQATIIEKDGSTLIAPEICIPDGVVATQIEDLVCLHIRDRPDERHFSAAVLAYVALNRAWPCND